MLLQINKSATVAWSPLTGPRAGLLALATTAGGVDASFDPTCSLEIYDVQRQASQPVGSTVLQESLFKLAWSPMDNSTSLSAGLLAGGMANGVVGLWDPAKILSKDSAEPALIASVERHSGPVQALDFNTFQTYLLASGAAHSEIFIWDLQNPSNPTVFTPGQNVSNQEDNVTCIAWNKKVAHILASTFSSGSCVIWDLKNKKPIRNFYDPSRARFRSVAWHPEEPRVIVTASDDDNSPRLAIWDLRNTSSPSRYLEGHTRGVSSVSWCPQDDSLLLSCGKDNKTICWNTITGTIVHDVETDSGTNWNIDVQWSPKKPALLSASSVEGKVKVYSLHDVNPRVRSVSSNDPFGHQPVIRPLTAPPKWLKKQVGATFGWGGLLVSGSKTKPSAINITTVPSEQSLLDPATKLDTVLKEKTFQEFCDQKISTTNSPNDATTWEFLKIQFQKDSRKELISYLGFEPEKLKADIHNFIEGIVSNQKEDAPPQVVNEPAITTPPVQETPATEEKTEEEDPFLTDETPQPRTTQEKDLAGFFASDTSDADLFDLTPVPSAVPPTTPSKPSLATAVVAAAPVPSISVVETLQMFSNEENDNVITKSLLIGDFEAAVECSIRRDKWDDALLLASCGAPELFEKTRNAYFAKQQRPAMKILRRISKREFTELVQEINLKFWKETLVLLCTYAHPDEVDQHFGSLARRLEESGDLHSATLCYICSGNIPKIINSWLVSLGNSGLKPVNALQEFIERVSILRASIGHTEMFNELVDKYCQYAEILAAQGHFEIALSFISFLRDPKYSSSHYTLLYERVYNAQRAIEAKAREAAQPIVQPTPQPTPSGVYSGYQPTPYQPVPSGPAPTSYPGYQPPPSSHNYGAPPPSNLPPTAPPSVPSTHNYGVPPPSTLGNAPPTHNYGAPPPTNTAPPSTTQNYGAPPTNLGNVPPTNAPSTTQNYGVPPPSTLGNVPPTHNYGAPPPTTTAPPSTQGSYGYGSQPPTSYPGPVSTSSSFSAPPPTSTPVGPPTSLPNPVSGQVPPTSWGGSNVTPMAVTTPPSSISGPINSTPASGSAPPPASTSQTNVPVAEATGDAKIIIDTLKSLTQRIQDGKKAKEVEDKLEHMYLRLRKGEVSADAIRLLLEFSKALQTSDNSRCNQLILELPKQHTAIGANGILGLKNLKRNICG